MRLPSPFIINASNILGDTEKGLSGSNIVNAFNGYAFEFNIEIPYSDMSGAPNKRTALKENLMQFTDEQQYKIIKELCEHTKLQNPIPDDILNLKIQLIARYGKKFGIISETTLDVDLINEVKHWLENYERSYKLYEQAFIKFSNSIFERNLLDDLRLSLELLLKEIFSNEKSLENQVSEIGTFINSNGGSTNFTNMFKKLVDYYSKYQNTFVKHDDAVIEEEIEFMFEMTSSFMKHLVKMKIRDTK